jgi:hypothetical protein
MTTRPLPDFLREIIRGSCARNGLGAAVAEFLIMEAEARGTFRGQLLTKAFKAADDFGAGLHPSVWSFLKTAGGNELARKYFASTASLRRLAEAKNSGQLAKPDHRWDEVIAEFNASHTSKQTT